MPNENAAGVADLLRQLTYLQSGGTLPGQSTTEKLNQIFGTIQQGAINYQGIVKEALANKKAQLENQKIPLETEKLRIETTPLGEILGVPSSEQDVALAQKWNQAQAMPTPVTPTTPFSSLREAQLKSLKDQGFNIPEELLKLTPKTLADTGLAYQRF